MNEQEEPFLNMEDIQGMSITDIIARFGRIVVEQVRDQTIIQYDMIAKGQMHAPKDQVLYAKIQPLSIEACKVIHELIPLIIDSTIHNMLSMIEAQFSVDLVIRHPNGDINIQDYSDLLMGDYIDWVKQFSTQRYDFSF